MRATRFETNVSRPLLSFYLRLHAELQNLYCAVIGIGEDGGFIDNRFGVGFTDQVFRQLHLSQGRQERDRRFRTLILVHAVRG